MGYEVKIIKPENLDDRFKTILKDSNDDYIAELKNEILIDCMTKEDFTYGSVKSMRFKISCLIQAIEENVKFNILNRFEHLEEGEDGVWFCGRHLTRPSTYNREISINNTLETCLLYKYVIPTPDYFEDSEKFFEKVDKIKEELEFEDYISDEITADFCMTYKKEENESY